MKTCENGICSRLPGDECILESYFRNRRTNTLRERAELAISVKNMGDNCPKVGDLAQKYPQRLAASRKALKQLNPKRP